MKENVYIVADLVEGFEWIASVVRGGGDVLYRTGKYDNRAAAVAECEEHCRRYGLSVAAESGSDPTERGQAFMALAINAIRQYENERIAHGQYPTATMQELLYRAQTYALLAIAAAQIERR